MNCNMTLWTQVVEELGLARQCEASHHPHSPEERAELFHAADGGSTEFEYLNLVHALILAAKPSYLLETGTYNGYGTLAIASAIALNGCGRVTSVDVGECQGARELVKRYGLEPHVEFVQSESVQFCAQWTNQPFDFAFFDSDVSVRHRECDLLIQRKKLSKGALAVFHDSSDTRYGVATSWEMIHYLQGLPGGLTFNLSRGLRVWQA